MKKLAYLLLSFLIFYFGVVAVNNVVQLGLTISQGNVILLWGYYGLLGSIVLFLGIVPLVKLINRPSLRALQACGEDPAKLRRFINRIYKGLQKEEQERYIAIDANDGHAQREWLLSVLDRDLSGYNQIILGYANKTTISVMISPNAFIDGLIILISNINMITALNRQTRVRIGLRDTLSILFKIAAFSSFIGITEEFSEIIEDAAEELIEEFNDVLVMDGPNQMVASIPGLKILPKLISPLLQGAANYAFVFYVGYAYKQFVRAYAVQNRNTLDEEGIKKTARKSARREKRIFMGQAMKELSSSAARQGNTAVRKGITQFTDYLKRQFEANGAE